jgi:hypothetical protein
MKGKLAKLAGTVLLATTMIGCGGGYYRAAGPPPRPYGYGVGRAPGPGYVWVDSYRDWRGNRWVQVPGSWMRPPRPHARWAPGYFDQRGRNRVWVRGRWRW